MASLERLLTDDESLVLVVRRHVLVLTWPFLALLVVLGVGGFLATVLPGGSAFLPSVIVLGVVAVVLVARLVVWPFLVWWTTVHAVTTHRLILRSGVLNRSGHDMPLVRITDVGFTQSLFERVLGAGTLTVESAGDRGPIVLEDVPHVDHAQRTIHELADDARGSEGRRG